MAAGSKLVLEFQDSLGDTIVHTFPYAKAGVTAAQVKTLMDTIISNGSIFYSKPATKVSAKIIFTTESNFSLS